MKNMTAIYITQIILLKNDDNTGETIRTDDSSSNSINVYYQTKLATGRWLPVVKNNEDYAGIRGQSITGLASHNRYRLYKIQSPCGQWLAGFHRQPQH